MIERELLHDFFVMHACFVLLKEKETKRDAFLVEHWMTQKLATDRVLVKDTNSNSRKRALHEESNGNDNDASEEIKVPRVSPELES
ncbi:hypothetical protein Ciccas_010596 [Cichlidogyrus casuarinus]|uniref:Uncharacterized protein n=1 Tax=Cichlidogyrus casuarinus TaxID=1844966 RepID=A0ABD2PTQ3_9PLAT